MSSLAQVLPTTPEELLEETAVVLQLLAFTMAFIAQPGTPMLVSKVLATSAQHTAINWAEMLDAETSAFTGGAQ